MRTCRHSLARVGAVPVASTSRSGCGGVLRDCSMAVFRSARSAARRNCHGASTVNAAMAKQITTAVNATHPGRSRTRHRMPPP